VAVRPQLLKSLGETMVTLDKAELSAKLEKAGLPYAPITRPDQLVEDPHLLQSGGMVPMTTDDGGTTKTLLLPLTLGGRRLGVRKPLPRIGEDTAAVLDSLPTHR
jgi:crotonobetainyl-CoA:carnitine CoA-transferase CaiB-like acyl-CoA transferase